VKRLLREDGGSMAVLTVVLLPVILVVLTGVLELGSARLIAERARIAADLASVVAVNDQDDAELARTGVLRPAADAVDVARAQLAAGLASLPALAATPEAIAASADVAVIQRSAQDPRSGRAHLGPTVRIAADVPIVTPAFAALLGRPVTVIHIWSASSAR
jgi:Flp pilus assembly protein TadG